MTMFKTLNIAAAAAAANNNNKYAHCERVKCSINHSNSQQINICFEYFKRLI